MVVKKVIIILALVMLGFFSGCANDDTENANDDDIHISATLEVEILTAESEPLAEPVEVFGTIAAKQSSAIGALVEGPLETMFVTVGDRVKRDILWQGAQGLAADFDAHDRVHEVAGAELADQFLLFDVDHHGIFLAAVDHGGNTTFAAQLTGGSLASPFARFGRQGQSVAHGSCLSSMR